MIIFWVLFGILILFYIVTFLYQHDFSLPTKTLNRYKKVLIIFPHPDDEVLTAGGLLWQLNKLKNNGSLIVLTKGEAGEMSFETQVDIKKIRTEEAKESGNSLRANLVLIKDFGDGKLVENGSQLNNYLRTLLRDQDPDLVITYDLAGLYGHEDHIVTSEIITGLIKKDFPKIALWYPSVAPHVLALLHLPEHMARNPEFRKRRVLPTHKVFVGAAVWAKIKAIYSYRSQRKSIESGFPFRPIPMAVFISQTIYEYFHEAWPGSTE